MLSTVFVVHFVCMALSFWGAPPLDPPLILAATLVFSQLNTNKNSAEKTFVDCLVLQNMCGLIMEAM